MGVIINPRGTGGSGKTELARRILAEYGWNDGGRMEPIHRAGRARPMGYRLRHPLGGRPLVVLGHYERTSGGCDTIPAADGGLDEIVCLADTWAAAGHDVLLEGSAWSAEYRRSAVLAANYRVHVLFLATPPEKAIRNLVARRRASRATWPLITRAVLAQRETIEVACGKLRGTAEVEEWTFDGALDRVRDLLGFGPLAEEAGVIW